MLNICQPALPQLVGNVISTRASAVAIRLHRTLRVEDKAIALQHGEMSRLTRSHRRASLRAHPPSRNRQQADPCFLA